MVKSWTDVAWEDFEYWTREDRKTLKRILHFCATSTVMATVALGNRNR